MVHYVFSSNLTFESPAPKLHVKPIKIGEIEKIRKQKGTAIYLCGGGQFASWLLHHDQIDLLKIKLNPFVLGQGVRMFGDSKKDFK